MKFNGPSLEGKRELVSNKGYNNRNGLSPYLENWDRVFCKFSNACFKNDSNLYLHYPSFNFLPTLCSPSGGVMRNYTVEKSITNGYKRLESHYIQDPLFIYYLNLFNLFYLCLLSLVKPFNSGAYSRSLFSSS